MTFIGATDWANYRVNASVLVQAPAPSYNPNYVPVNRQVTWAHVATGLYAGVCVRQPSVSWWSGYCLLIGSGFVGTSIDVNESSWVLQEGGYNAKSPLASGVLHGVNLASWHRLSLAVHGQQLTGVIDDTVVAVVNCPANVNSVGAAGLASLRSGLHYAAFDNLYIDGGSASASNTAMGGGARALFDKTLLYPPKPPPGGPNDAAEPFQPAEDGLFGCKFTALAPLRVTALARFGATFPRSSRHTVSLIHVRTNLTVASAEVDINGTSTDGMGDINGFIWGALPESVQLQAGEQYYLVSTEGPQNLLYDQRVQVQSAPYTLHGYPVSARFVKGIWQSGTDLPPAGLPSPVPSTQPSSIVWHAIKSRLSGQCFDEAGAHIDTWLCPPNRAHPAGDFTNERFNFSVSTGQIIAFNSRHCLIGQSDGACVVGGSRTLCTIRCPANAHARWGYDKATGVLGFSNDTHKPGVLCLAATTEPRLDAPLTLQPCKSPPPKAHQYDFVPAPLPPRPPPTPTPSPPTNAKLPPWGTCFGPLNVAVHN